MAWSRNKKQKPRKLALAGVRGRKANAFRIAFERRVQVAKVALVIWDAMYMGRDFPTLSMNVQAIGLLFVAAPSRRRGSPLSARSAMCSRE